MIKCLGLFILCRSDFVKNEMEENVSEHHHISVIQTVTHQLIIRIIRAPVNTSAPTLFSALFTVTLHPVHLFVVLLFFSPSASPPLHRVDKAVRPNAQREPRHLIYRHFPLLQRDAVLGLSRRLNRRRREDTAGSEGD